MIGIRAPGTLEEFPETLPGSLGLTYSHFTDGKTEVRREGPCTKPHSSYGKVQGSWQKSGFLAEIRKWAGPRPPEGQAHAGYWQGSQPKRTEMRKDNNSISCAQYYIDCLCAYLLTFTQSMQ